MNAIFDESDFKDADGFGANPTAAAIIANAKFAKWVAQWTSDEPLVERDMRHALIRADKRNVMLTNLVEGLRLEMAHLRNPSAPESVIEKFKLADQLIEEAHRDARERQKNESSDDRSKAERSGQPDQDCGL